MSWSASRTTETCLDPLAPGSAQRSALKAAQRPLAPSQTVEESLFEATRGLEGLDGGGTWKTPVGSSSASKAARTAGGRPDDGQRRNARTEGS